MTDFVAIARVVCAHKDELNNLYKLPLDSLDAILKRSKSAHQSAHQPARQSAQSLSADECYAGAIEQLFECSKLERTHSNYLALKKRLLDLKDQSLKIALNAHHTDKSTLEQCYDVVARFWEQNHAQLISKIKSSCQISEFYARLLDMVHEIGCVLNTAQKHWQRVVIDDGVECLERFDSAQVYQTLRKLGLYQLDGGTICDRAYGAISDGISGIGAKQARVMAQQTKFSQDMADMAQQTKFDQNALERLLDGYKMLSYSEIFTSEFERIDEIFGAFIAGARALDDDERAYLEYIKALKSAMQEKHDPISAYQRCESAWMAVRSPLQIGHFLEYYEDRFTHAVALEWDIRIDDGYSFDADEFRSQLERAFRSIYERAIAELSSDHLIAANADNIAAANTSAKNFAITTAGTATTKTTTKTAINAQAAASAKENTLANISRAQFYICTPMVFYAAELNGLFSAQVVPNDEKISAKYGKKIFAFLNYVYESTKAKDFVKLSRVVFDDEFLRFGLWVLYANKPLWARVYEICTIGHEGGHMFFMDTDTELALNQSGAYKNIEEFKATSGGLYKHFFVDTADGDFGANFGADYAANSADFCANSADFAKNSAKTTTNLRVQIDPGLSNHLAQMGLGADDALDMAVFYDVIRRAVGLCAWRDESDVSAYYTEGLIFLGILFDSGVLAWSGSSGGCSGAFDSGADGANSAGGANGADGTTSEISFVDSSLDSGADSQTSASGRLLIDFSKDSLERFKSEFLRAYTKLAQVYLQKRDAMEFLNDFCVYKNGNYYSNRPSVHDFATHYHHLHEKYANELDLSGDFDSFKSQSF